MNHELQVTICEFENKTEIYKKNFDLESWKCKLGIDLHKLGE